MRKILVFLLWTIPFSKAFAQHYPLTELNFDDGLNRSSFYEVAKDPQGYLWLAAEAGLIRYDGKEFKAYSGKDGFKGNFVLDIDFDENGQMWISTYGGGIARFDGERFHPFNTSNGFPANYVRSVMIASNGDVWVSTEDNGPIRIQKGKKPEVVNERLPKPIQNSWTCHEDKKGDIWVAAIGGLGKFVKSKNYAYELVFSTIYTLTSITEDQQGNIWAGGAYTLIKVENDSVTDLTARMPENTIIFDMEVGKKDHKLYLATADKLIIMDGDSVSYLDKRNGIANSQFWDVYEDDVNEIWLSSAGGGVIKYDDEGISWYDGDADFKFGSAVQDIVEEKNGRIIFGTELNGYYKYENGHFSKFEQPEVAGIITGYATAYSPEYNMTLFTSANGSVTWMRNDKVIYHHLSSRSGGVTIYGINFLDSNDVVLSTDAGCYTIRRDGKGPQLIESIPQAFYRSVFKDEYGYLWAMGDNGDIYRYKNGVAKNFQSIVNPHKKSVLTGSYDPFYKLYFFCTSSGLIIWDGKASLILDQNNVLGGDVAGGVVRDHKNRLWIGHENGFTCINMQTKEVSHIGYDQGFRSVAVNFRSTLMSKTGILYAGSVNDLYKINVHELAPKNRHIKLRLQNIFFRDQVYFKENYFTDSLPDLYLEHDQNNFQIDLAALDFTNASKVKYSWMLKGFDKDFMPYSLLNEVNYTNLAPGDYEFIAKSIDSEGFETNEVKIKIHIAKPFWEKLWFYALEVGIFVVIAMMSFAFSGKKSNNRFGQIMTFLTIIILFESMIFYLSNFINPLTNGIPVFQLVMNIILAAILQPMEQWVKKMMTKRKQSKSTQHTG